MPVQTLKEIAAEKANKQPGMVDSITEDAPLLAEVKWKAATHGGWNTAEVVTGIQGPGFVEGNAPFPQMTVDGDLKQTHVSIMGGEIEVSATKASRMGGAAKYFADRQDKILRQAGMNTETNLYYNYFLRAAVDCGNVVDMNGTADSGDTTGLYSIVITRFDEDSNIGIYNAEQFDSGRLLKIDPINGGNKYHLRSLPEVLGYGVAYVGEFGWQLLDPKRTVSAIINVKSTALPDMIDMAKALTMVRATPANTRIVCNPFASVLAFGSMKKDKLQATSTDQNISPDVKSFADIPIIKTYNALNGNEAHI